MAVLPSLLDAAKTISFVVVRQTIARRLPSSDQAKFAIVRGWFSKRVIWRGGAPSIGSDQMFDPLVST